MDPHAPANALTIDVEDWFHDETRPQGAALPAEVAAVGRRVEDNLLRLLDLLAACDTRATLFFLGEVAADHPDLVRRAQAGGHEIACHGLRHRPAPSLARAELAREIARARATLEDIAGSPVAGFRAPCFLRRPSDLWVLEVVAECGFAYDSSYLPLDYRPRSVELLGGTPGAVRLESGLWEFPLPLSRLPRGHLLPCAAGGFALRALPYGFTRHFVARFNREVGPAIVYTHPWEIDPASPKLPGTPAYVRFFNRLGRRSVTRKLRRLLADFRFAPIREVFASELAGS